MPDRFSGQPPRRPQTQSSSDHRKVSQELLERPRLGLAPTPKTIYTFACLGAEERGEVVGC
jgi:hypothetical protein